MSWPLTLSLGLLCALAVTVYSYPDGAPDIACEMMTPFHPSDPDVRSSFTPVSDETGVETHEPSTDPFPFEIVASRTCYRPVQMVQVHIRRTDSCQNVKIEGLFAQVRPDADTYEPKGEWTAVTDTKLVSCSGMDAGALTHSTKQSGNAIILDWTAPGDDQGTLRFVITVLGAFDNFWVKQVSEPIMFDDSCSDTVVENFTDDTCGEQVDSPESPEDPETTDEPESNNAMPITVFGTFILLTGLTAIAYIVFH